MVVIPEIIHVFKRLKRTACVFKSLLEVGDRFIEIVDFAEVFDAESQ